MSAIEIHVHEHVDTGEILQRLAGLDTKVTALQEQVKTMAKDLAALLQNMTDLQGIAGQYLALIIAKDQANAALQAQITDLVNQHVTDTTEKQALLDGIAQAVDASQATEDQMRAGLPGVPPVGGTPLNLSYADRASFDAAVAAYTGPESVSIDGTPTPKTGSPDLAYFSHSADGSVSTTGPTD